MKKYLVGGAVRDRLMGEEPRDFDYVIVGATEEEKRFLTQSWRRISQGYEVYQTENYDEVTFTTQSMEEDVRRRDFTCNAVAYDTESDILIDPLHGADDICNKVVRAVSYRNLQEDPVRALRGMRMLAVLSSKEGVATLDPETEQWISEFVLMAFEKEPSRAWQEIQKIMSEPYWFVAIRALSPYTSWLKVPSGGDCGVVANPEIRSALCMSHVVDWTGYGGLKRWERLARGVGALSTINLSNAEALWLFWKNHKNIAEELRECIAFLGYDERIMQVYDILYTQEQLKQIEHNVIVHQGCKGKAIAEAIHLQAVRCIHNMITSGPIYDY